MRYYLIHHHPRGPHATGPYLTEADALDAAGSNPLPRDVSILCLESIDPLTHIGRACVYPPSSEHAQLDVRAPQGS